MYFAIVSEYFWGKDTNIWPVSDDGATSGHTKKANKKYEACDETYENLQK